MYGLCLGCWYLLVPVLLADLFGTERISSSYGLIRMFQSVGAISVPPLAGFLKDLTGGYEVCFYCMGACDPYTVLAKSLNTVEKNIFFRNKFSTALSIQVILVLNER